MCLCLCLCLNVAAQTQETDGDARLVSDLIAENARLAQEVEQLRQQRQQVHRNTFFSAPLN